MIHEIANIIKLEGGYVNHKADLGGPTKYGITLGTYRRVINREGTIEHIKSLTKYEAQEIYKKDYWDKMRLDEVEDSKLRTVLLNIGVHRGTKAAVKDLQRQLNLYYGIKLKVDGYLGNKTIKVVNSRDFILSALPLDLVLKTQLHYVKLVKRRPEQMVFLLGWMKRSQDLIWKVYGC